VSAQAEADKLWTLWQAVLDQHIATLKAEAPSAASVVAAQRFLEANNIALSAMSVRRPLAPPDYSNLPFPLEDPKEALHASRTYADTSGAAEAPIEAVVKAERVS
jgi:hypothetical protein